MPDPLVDPQVEKLRAFIRQYAPGQCKILSKGDLCDCLLCTVDALERDSHEMAQLRVQLAGCLIAAEGATSSAAVARRGDYGWSYAYDTVLKLRIRYDRLEELMTPKGHR